MKFEYDEEKDRGECVAYLHQMTGDVEPTKSLAIKVDDGRVVTLYYSGCIKVQDCYEENCGNDMIRRFYKGDKITITF